jgi:hypothetical protein
MNDQVTGSNDTPDEARALIRSLTGNLGWLVLYLDRDGLLSVDLAGKVKEDAEALHKLATGG